MNRFNNGKLTRMLRELPDAADEAAFLYSEGAIDHDDSGPLTIPLRNLADEVERLGLADNARAIRRLADAFKDPASRKGFKDRIAAIQVLLEERMDTVAFFAVPAARKEWLAKTAAGDIVTQEVVDEFPDSIYELEEAASCFAFARFTACALHLMRACEPAVQSFAKKIGRPQGVNNWGDFFSTWSGLSSRERAPFAAAFEPFVAIKDALRNQLMHAKIRCDEEEAVRLLANVPAFLKAVHSLP